MKNKSGFYIITEGNTSTIGKQLDNRNTEVKKKNPNGNIYRKILFDKHCSISEFVQDVLRWGKGGLNLVV